VEEWWFEIGATLVIGALAFFGKRELTRKDEDVKDAMRRLDTHIRECRDQHDKVADTLLDVSKAVARIEGRLGGP
jgi:hypothetical protein